MATANSKKAKDDLRRKNAAQVTPGNEKLPEKGIPETTELLTIKLAKNKDGYILSFDTIEWLTKHKKGTTEFDGISIVENLKGKKQIMGTLYEFVSDIVYEK